MSSYRTGNHHGVTIVREGEKHPGYAPCRACESGAATGHDCHPDDHDRKARGPHPGPIGPGCICDGSGRTCPRHGVVL